MDKNIFLEASASTEPCFEIRTASSIESYPISQFMVFQSKCNTLQTAGVKYSAIRIVNSYYIFLKDARSILLETLSKYKNHEYIPPEDLLRIILNSGIALHNQLDRGSNNPKGYQQRLEELIGKCEFYDDYINNQHKYFLAAKHIENEEHKENREKLFGNEGLKIAMNFFEVVRKIFIKYHSKIGTCNYWDILQEINYTDFNL